MTTEAPEIPTTSDPILELSTEVEPAKLIQIDGEDYKLLGFEHLDEEQEVKATAAFARHAKLMQALGEEPSIAKSEQISKKLRDNRIKLLAMLTTAPEEVIEKLPMTAAAKLLSAVEEEVGVDGVIPE